MTNLNDQNFNIFNSPAVAHVPDTAPVAAAAYEPPSFLVSSTQLSNEDLVRQYNGSCPQLVVDLLLIHLDGSLHKRNPIYPRGP